MRRKTTLLAGALGAISLATLAGIAAAGALGNGDERPPELEARRAIEAALALTGGGSANSVELDSEDGATYEVEVTRPGGTTVDVRLDAAFQLVVIEGDTEEPDSDADGDG